VWGCRQEKRDVVSCSGQNDVEESARAFEGFLLLTEVVSRAEDGDDGVCFTTLGLVKVHHLDGSLIAGICFGE
jgi:hypothetical protein